MKLKVHPGSKRSSIVKRSEDSFEIWVTAPTERGLANKAAIHSLAQALNLNPGRIHIVKGATSPSKIVNIIFSEV